MAVPKRHGSSSAGNGARVAPARPKYRTSGEAHENRVRNLSIRADDVIRDHKNDAASGHKSRNSFRRKKSDLSRSNPAARKDAAIKLKRARRVKQNVDPDIAPKVAKRRAITARNDARQMRLGFAR